MQEDVSNFQRILNQKPDTDPLKDKYGPKSSAGFANFPQGRALDGQSNLTALQSPSNHQTHSQQLNDQVTAGSVFSEYPSANAAPKTGQLPEMPTVLLQNNRLTRLECDSVEWQSLVEETLPVKLEGTLKVDSTSLSKDAVLNNGSLFSEVRGIAGKDFQNLASSKPFRHLSAEGLLSTQNQSIEPQLSQGFDQPATVLQKLGAQTTESVDAQFKPSPSQDLPETVVKGAELVQDVSMQVLPNNGLSTASFPLVGATYGQQNSSTDIRNQLTKPNEINNSWANSAFAQNVEETAAILESKQFVKMLNDAFTLDAMGMPMEPSKGKGAAEQLASHAAILGERPYKETADKSSSLLHSDKHDPLPLNLAVSMSSGGVQQDINQTINIGKIATNIDELDRLIQKITQHVLVSDAQAAKSAVQFIVQDGALANTGISIQRSLGEVSIVLRIPDAVNQSMMESLHAQLSRHLNEQLPNEIITVEFESYPDDGQSSDDSNEHQDQQQSSDEQFTWLEDEEDKP